MPHGADAALFREAVGDVTPLAEQNRIVPTPPRTQARVRAALPPPALADRLSDFADAETADSFLRNGLSRLTLRPLRRGGYPIAATLDLHGHQADSARRLLQQFLHHATEHQLRCVRVIHGKGMNSPGGTGLLRILTRNWLTQHPAVLAFCPAPPAQGGSGAALILLKIRP